MRKQQNWKYVSCHNCIDWPRRKFQIHNLVTETTMLISPSKAATENKQNEWQGGPFQHNSWEAQEPTLPLSEEVNREGQGALLSCSQRQFHSRFIKLPAMNVSFASSWLFASNADICVRYTKPFLLLKSYQHLHARFEQDRSCSTQGIRRDYPETDNRF